MNDKQQSPSKQIGISTKDSPAGSQIKYGGDNILHYQ
jgi:hypothetical protein